MDNVVQLRKLQMWIWANKRWKIWQKTNICGENFTVKHWTIITLNLETFCGGESGVFSSILSEVTSQTDRRESWERLNGGNLGIWAGQGREGTAVSEELNHLSGPAHQRSGCLMQRGTLGSWSWYEIDLITPRISISLLPSTARGLPCPPIGQTSVDISAGGERDFWLVFITELLCDTKPDLKRGRDPGAPAL